MRRFRAFHAEAGQAVPALVMMLGGTALAGLLVGGLLGFLGGVDLVAEPEQVVGAATASYYDCPGGSPLGEVTRGDRVFITARDDSGGWIQVRSPSQVESRSWMRATHVLPDDVLDDIPIVSCGVRVEAGVETSTTGPADTTTSSTTTSGTTTTSTTGTTLPAGPSVGVITVSDDPIWESYFEDDVCNANPGQPSRTLVSADVSIPAGVQSVILSWSVGGESGSEPMSLAGGDYHAWIGPFPAEDPSIVPPGGSLAISITVEITDALQRQSTGQMTVVLNDCTFV